MAGAVYETVMFDMMPTERRHLLRLSVTDFIAPSFTCLLLRRLIPRSTVGDKGLLLCLLIADVIVPVGLLSRFTCSASLSDLGLSRSQTIVINRQHYYLL